MEGAGGLPDQTLSVIPDDVRDVGRTAGEIARTLRSALESAGRDVDGLTSGGWTGEAADAFATGWRECHEGGNRVLEALTSLAAKLGATAETYVDRDQRSASSLRLDVPESS